MRSKTTRGKGSGPWSPLESLKCSLKSGGNDHQFPLCLDAIADGHGLADSDNPSKHIRNYQ